MKAEAKGPQIPVPDSSYLGGQPDTWPDDLASFQDWWMSEASLDDGGSHPRIAPRGPADAELMVLLPQPLESDGKQLVDGAAEKFLATILAAMRIERDNVYFGSVLPRYSPLPDWDELKARGVGKLTRHHIALAKPQRILLLGRSVLPIIINQNDAETSQSPAQPVGLPLEIAIQGAKIPLLAAHQLGDLARSPQRRKRLWQNWLDWTTR